MSNLSVGDIVRKYGLNFSHDAGKEAYYEIGQGCDNEDAVRINNEIEKLFVQGGAKVTARLQYQIEAIVSMNPKDAVQDPSSYFEGALLSIIRRDGAPPAITTIKKNEAYYTVVVTANTRGDVRFGKMKTGIKGAMEAMP